jgi:hypothetical protein
MITMDLDTLIREADPANNATTPDPDSASARRACERLITGERRRRRQRARGAAVLASAGVAAGVFVLVIPGNSPVTVAPAAAAVLTRAGIAAQGNPSLTLGPGQYLYSEIRTLAASYWQWGNPNMGAWTVQPETVQTWVAANGSDRRLTTYDGPEQFATSTSQANWIASGKPDISSLTNTPNGAYDTHDGPGGFAPPDDLSQLPTDPAALTQLIETGKTGLVEAEAPRTVPQTSAYTFATAATILATPALNSSPALRSALYSVMADTPGIVLVGSATDHSGRTGTEIAGPLGGGIGTGVPYGADGARVEVIIDPSTGEVLETSEVNVDPALDNGQLKTDFTAGQVLTWTDYLGSGVVGSTAAAPTGTASPMGATGETGVTGATGGP